MTLTEFAKIVCVSKLAVSRACKPGGRLEHFVERDPGGRACGIRDPEKAAAYWRANTDHTHTSAGVLARLEANRRGVAPPAPAESEGPDGEIGLTHWKTKLAELKYKEAAQELVPVRDVSARLTDVFRTCRTKLLGIPSRARQALPHLTVADVGTLEDLIREALEELSEGGRE